MADQRMDPLPDHPTIRADFENTDIHGRIRLNTLEAVDDIRRLGVALDDGVELNLVDDDRSAVGIVSFAEHEAVWVAEVDWDDVVPAEFSYENRKFRPTSPEEIAEIRTSLRAAHGRLYDHLEKLFFQVDPYDVAYPDSNLGEPNPEEYEGVVWEALPGLRSDMDDEDIVSVIVDAFRMEFEGEPVSAAARLEITAAIPSIRALLTATA